MKLGGEDGSWGEGCDGEAEANGVLSVEGQLQGVALRPSGVCDVAGGPGGAHHVRRFHAPPPTRVCNSQGRCGPQTR